MSREGCLWSHKPGAHSAPSEDTWAFILSSLPSLSLPPMFPCPPGDQTVPPFHAGRKVSERGHHAPFQSSPNQKQLFTQRSHV